MRRGPIRAWREVAREHGVTRVRIGFDISQLVREFIMLRHVIREVAAELAPPPEKYEPILADLFDAAISAAVQSYMDARDYEGRRHQAENIGFITHELRNPLATALLSVSQLRKQEPGPDPRVLDRMERSLRNMDQLIAGVLLTEKLETGARQAELVTTRLGPVVDGAVEGARAPGQAEGARLSPDPRSGAGRAHRSGPDPLGPAEPGRQRREVHRHG